MSDIASLLHSGFAHHSQNRYAEAEHAYRRVLRQEPDNPDALHLLGLLARKMGHFDAAIEFIARSVAVRPNFVDAVYNLGNALQTVHRLDEAEAAYRHAIALKDDHDWAHLHLGNVLYKGKRFDEAMAACDRAREHRLVQQLRTRLTALRSGRPQPGPQARNLVLGFAVGYNSAQLAPFVLSLQATGFTGDIVLFLSETPPEAIDWLARHNVRVEPAEPYRYMGFHMAHARFFLYDAFLMRHQFPWPEAGRYANVFMSDVRDVVFQSDPFAAQGERDLICCNESRNTPIGACDANSVWIRNMFGDETLARLADQPISCVGTILGTFAGTLEYLIHMQLLSFEVPYNTRHMHGIDQGIHNIIIHSGRMPTLVTSDNTELVGTVGYGLDGAHLDTEQRLCNAAGAVIPVVHQYDRNPEYAAVFLRRFASTT